MLDFRERHMLIAAIKAQFPEGLSVKHNTLSAKCWGSEGSF